MYGTETVAGNISDLGLDAHTCCGPGFSSVFSAPSDPGQTKQREVPIGTELLGQSPIHGDPLHSFNSQPPDPGLELSTLF